MIKSLLKLNILLCIVCSLSSGWIFGSTSKVHSNKVKTEKDQSLSLTDGSNKFEMKLVDEQFLLQVGENGNELSTLDFCHHRVILMLKRTCDELNEEEMGKLSVELLNCQLEAEDRQTFPCSYDMVLAECTQFMDGSMWNAYQIVSNRARAICYATRQQHFRMKTEHSVNQLIHSTEQQVVAMHVLEEGHKKMSDATMDTLNKMANDQNEWIEKQHFLYDSQKLIENSLQQSKEHLAEENKLLQSRNEDISKLTESMKSTLENATSHISKQEEIQKKNHEEVLSDLEKIRSNAVDTMSKIENNSQNMEIYQNVTKQHLVDTINNLQKVNKTIISVASTINILHETFERKLDLIASMMGWTGDQILLLTSLTWHSVYLIVGCIIAAFLNLPMFSRIIFVTIIPLNAWSCCCGFSFLSFSPLTITICVMILMNLLFRWIFILISKVPRNSQEDYEPSQVYEKDICNSINDIETTLVSKSDIEKIAAKLLKELQEQKDTKALSEKVKCTNDDAIDVNISTYNACVNSDNSELMDQNVTFGNVLDDNILIEESNISDHLYRVDAIKKNLLTNMLTAINPDISNITSTPDKSLNSSVRTSPGRSPGRSGRKNKSFSFSKPLCEGLTKAGLPCRNMQQDGSLFCYRHNNSVMEASIVDS